METRGALFREIHKNTWLKRLTPEGKKITVGVKKSERNWVVFCVHDDTEALLEGYAEPRIAASHSPEWVVNLQTTQHISHALVPSEQEYEFVITLSNEVVRFHAISWEIMQEWVDTLRSKLREMKILSPKENLYTKLPEARAPLLPTRDPTSPLPATPPVPAAIVPGVECVVPLANSLSTSSAALNEPSTSTNNRSITENTPTTPVIFNSSQSTNIVPQSNNIVAMSNTSTQNLLNMLNDPISNYSVQVSETNIGEENDEEESISSATNSINLRSNPSTSNSVHSGALNKTDVSILPGTFSSSFLSDSNTRPALSNAISVKSNSIENSIRVDVNCLKGTSVDINSTSEPASPVESKVFSRPPTVRSISLSEPSVGRPSTSNNNITELDVQNNISGLEVEPVVEPTTNITIIQVSNPLPVNKTPEIFKFPPPENLSIHEEYKSNVQIIPSSLSTIPVNTTNNQYSTAVKKNSESVVESSQVTKVHVTGKNLDTSYGNVCPSSSSSSPKIPKKIILSANTSGITNISVNNDINQLVTTSSTHYEKVFLTSSIPIAAQLTSDSTSPASRHARNLQRNDASQLDLPINLSRLRNKNTSVEINRNITNNKAIPSTSAANSSVRHRKSPAVTRRKAQLPDVGQENSPPPLTNRPLLTRGATEAVITARPSRIDMKKSRPRGPNNNAESHNPVDRTRSESLEQRRRSSSTSDVQSPRQKHGNSDARSRGQQPMQPIRLAQENAIVNASKRLTLREQQVLQLRREIMHPGGVRLKLRRKDCVGSIAWVDAFGAVWVAGWKQKDHPMLYNALHIGDQLISIAGIAISSAAEANKIIRNTNTLFLEILIRRIPFGRVYAIRRELEGQCLGLIRDGNTATIVDVVPNSLAARHGLPPKAQSCDGLSLTFWILTEVNGRPLNLFFKENEVRDRLNSVGRDISILVQPTDLVTKLKKQLKSLRSYKDYIVQ